MSSTTRDLEAMAEKLVASGQYRVLRKLRRRAPVVPPKTTPTRMGLFVDVETTGLDPQKNEIIELAMVPFIYGLDGEIFDVGEAYQRFQEPSAPIPPEITAITSITDEMVAGQCIDPAEVASFASGAALVVAHNAAFDRRFLERLSDVFETKPWACSMSQVDWASEGHEGTKLAYLAAGAGFFYDHHRAENDCLAAIELLATTLPVSGILAMASLLERARQPPGSHLRVDALRPSSRHRSYVARYRARAPARGAELILWAKKLRIAQSDLRSTSPRLLPFLSYA